MAGVQACNLIMKTIDTGHKYLLNNLDGGEPQTLTFVKRCDLANPSRFPGNTNAYPGTTLQNVIRALLERVRYLQNQIPCLQNRAIILMLRLCLWMLELRAAHRHGKRYWHGLDFAEFTPMCAGCGHTVCGCKHSS